MRGGEATTLAGSSLFCPGHNLVNKLSPPRREELTTLNRALTSARALTTPSESIQVMKSFESIIEALLRQPVPLSPTRMGQPRAPAGR